MKSRVLVGMLAVAVLQASASSEDTSLRDNCSADNQALLAAALNGSSRALRMLDSWGQLPVPSLLEGNVFLLGSFDECLTAGGKYCLTYVQLPKLTPEMFPEVKPHVLPLLASSGRSLRWAACVPTSCSGSDVILLMRRRIQELLPAMDSTVVDVIDNYCATAETPPLAPKELAFVCFIATIIMIVFVSTTVDLFLADKYGIKKGCAWLAFSARKNWQCLTAINQSGVCCLYGLKCLSMAWVVLFHTQSFALQSPAINSDEITSSVMNNWTYIPVTTGSGLAVNTFFLAGGLLVSSGFLRERASGSRFSLAGFYLHRYVRLTPAYAVMVFLFATVLPRLTDGPLWLERSVPESQRCESIWWMHLLYALNFLPGDKTCFTIAWYLASDMQLFWMSPLLLWPLYRAPRAAVVLCLVVISTTLVAVFSVTYICELPWGETLLLTGKNFDDFMNKLYFPVYSRIVPYAIGILLGWILMKDKTQNKQMSKVTVTSLWLISTALALFSLYGRYADYHLPYNPLEAAFYATLRTLAWPLAISWIIYACENNHAGPVNSILSWKGFQPLGRLSYGVYLTHVLVIRYKEESIRTPMAYEVYYVMHQTLANILVCLPIAVILYLSFEMPVLNLDRLWLKPVTKVKSTEAHP